MICCKYIALCLSLILFGFIPTSAQSKRTTRIQKKIVFEVVSANDANTLTTEKCSGFKILSVYVVPSSATEDKLRGISKKISSSYPKDIDMFIFFFVDRKLAKLSDALEGDNKLLEQSIRGIYARRIDKPLEVFKFLPDGLNDEIINGLLGEGS